MVASCKGDEKVNDWMHKVKVIGYVRMYLIYYVLCDTIWGRGRVISDKPGNCRGTQE
jgi:hypothetical protein